MKKATFKDQNTIINILHTTFITETFPNSINFVAKKDKKRSQSIYHLMKYQCKMALRFGEIFLSDDQLGCVLFLDSEKKKTTFTTLLWDMELVIRCIGISSIYNVLKREKILKNNHPKIPFLHLWIMGTLPKYRSKGIGTKLLSEVLAYYKNEKPIYLETTTERNRNFYIKLGFKVFNETHVLDYPLYFLLKL
ncbi:GNAT family N-acetyltransferase [Aquimarina longa]|uniref:GNAT family N-acetyltransferase n=1 Tax=Aquimarina longa TaxID=1080221 RepID=UPI00130E9D63|nr:GNAT family N-acetyltransferase [Aquimarina longa]